jgi:hypothetical protein
MRPVELEMIRKCLAMGKAVYVTYGSIAGRIESVRADGLLEFISPNGPVFVGPDELELIWIA